MERYAQRVEARFFGTSAVSASETTSGIGEFVVCKAAEAPKACKFETF